MRIIKYLIANNSLYVITEQCNISLRDLLQAQRSTNSAGVLAHQQSNQESQMSFSNETTEPLGQLACYDSNQSLQEHLA